MYRSLLAFLLAAAAALVPWHARSSAAATFTLGQVLSAMNTTQKIVSALPSPISSITSVDINQVTAPVDPCNALYPGDPCRLPSYYLAINRDAATILALRTALAQTSTTGGACLPNGDIPCTTIAQVLALQSVQTNTIVGASLSIGALVVFYDSNPAECVILPQDPCIPPNPV